MFTLTAKLQFLHDAQDLSVRVTLHVIVQSFVGTV